METVTSKVVVWMFMPRLGLSAVVDFALSKSNFPLF